MNNEHEIIYVDGVAYETDRPVEIVGDKIVLTVDGK